MQISPEAFSILTKAERFLSQQQIPAYVVGGFVRDTLLGRSTADIDIAIGADAMAVAARMADQLGGRYVLLDEANRIARVVFFPLSPETEKNSWYIDLSSLAGDIETDLARRDFTVNAMAVELKMLMSAPSGFPVIDLFHGREDLEARIIRTVSAAVFETDPARLLRAARLAAELGFVISEDTTELARRSHSLAARVAGERLREEFLRVLATSEAGKYIRYLDDIGVLTAVIPELEPARGVEQPVEHHWDVLNHSLQTVRAVEFLLRQNRWEYAPETILEYIPWSNKLSEHFSAAVGSGSTHGSLLKLAALLHDIAKPETKIIANDRVRFFGHNEQGAEVVVSIMEHLRFSNKEIKLVEAMVRYHMRPNQMSHEGQPTKRAIYRYFRDTGSAAVDILFLSLADHLAARGPELNAPQWQAQAEEANCLLTNCFQQSGVVAPPRLIDGHDLINIFGLRPGPEIREILEAVKEAQAAGELTSREEALYYVRNRLLYREQNLEE